MSEQMPEGATVAVEPLVGRLRVAAINDWHKMAAEALAAWESTT